MKCRTLSLLVILWLIQLAYLPLAFSDAHYNANTYPFTFPTYTTSMGFDTDMTFTTAYRVSDYWYFTTATVSEIGFQVQVANLLVTDFFVLDSNKLYFTVTAASGTSTTKIQVGIRGNATSVTGASSWIYDTGTHILTIYVIHSSAIAVIVNWGAGGDITPPTFSNVAHNTTIETQPCKFSAKCQDDIALSGYIFGYNGTGVWVNETWTALAANPDWANVTKTLPVASTIVGYRWYANDTSNNWGSTGIYSLTTTALGEDVTILLNLPSDGTTKYTNSVQFTYTPIFSSVIQNSSLWLNITGTWQRVAWNSSIVTNNTGNSLTYAFTDSNTYVWNIGVYNTTECVFGEFNRTLTMILEPRCMGTGYATPTQGRTCTLNSLWQDGDALSGYIPGSNITGTDKNETWIPITGAPLEYLATSDIILPQEVGTTITFWFYANDSDNKWGTSGLASLQVVSAGSAAGGGQARIGQIVLRNPALVLTVGVLVIAGAWYVFHPRRRR